MSARSLIKLIWRQMTKKWDEEGWILKVDLIEDPEVVAETLEDEQVVVLRPHTKKDLPIELSLWHELLHVWLDTEEREDVICQWERETWPILPREARQHLRKMIKDVTEGKATS